MSINQIEQALLAPNGLTEQDIADTLASIATRQIDYADIYFQSSWHESLVLEDSIIKDGSFNIDCGVGVRAVTGEGSRPAGQADPAECADTLGRG